MSTVSHVPVERLWELYSYNPLTGKLISNTTKKPVKGFVINHPKHYLVRMSVWHHKNGKRYPFQTGYHRVVYAWVHGNWPENQIDHIDRNSHNNRVWNLRDVSARVNNQNRKNFVGATFNKQHKMWIAQAIIDGKFTCVGRCKTMEEAQSAYWKAVADQN
jgi:hypothetical protein